MPPTKKKQANLRVSRKKIVEDFNWPVKQEPETSSAGSSRKSKSNKDESHAPESSQITHEIMLKEEPIDPDEMDMPAEEEEEQVEEPRKPHCIFCFKVVTSGVADQEQQRTTIEFVLGTTLERSMEAVTCPNCWQMFLLCLQFKRSCLYALSKKDEIASSVPRKDGQEYDEPRKQQSYSSEFILDTLPETPSVVGSPAVSETHSVSPELLLPDDGNDFDWRQEPKSGTSTLLSRSTHLQCMKCNGLFEKFRPFQLHKPSCSGIAKSPQCKDSSNLVCQKCHVRFPTLARVKNHLQTFHSPTLQHCPHCTMIFYDKQIYRAHMAQHEGAKKHQAVQPGGSKKFK